MKQYLQLFLNGVQKKNHRPGKCYAVAFTSYLPEEGVSYVSQSFGVEIAKRTGKRTLIADAKRLSQVNIMHYSRVTENCFPTDVANLWSLPPVEDDEEFDAEINGEMPGENMYLQAYKNNPTEIALNNLQTLRFAFDYILLDCPALSVSDETVFLAPEADGVMVVVEADRTKREQIQNAQQTIESTDANLLGFILNKRQYTVPNWLYKRL
jgi:Mrp family chromosome partitioning ATPase